MNIFLDDIRNPDDVTWIELPVLPPGETWQVVRTFDQFMDVLQQAIFNCTPIKRISFDHDLADLHHNGERTGYHAANALAAVVMDEGWGIPEYTAHSMNPIGVAKIHEAMLDVYRYRRMQDGDGQRT